MCECCVIHVDTVHSTRCTCSLYGCIPVVIQLAGKKCLFRGEATQCRVRQSMLKPEVNTRMNSELLARANNKAKSVGMRE